jgi:hypothetical protein
MVTRWVGAAALVFATACGGKAPASGGGAGTSGSAGSPGSAGTSAAAGTSGAAGTAASAGTSGAAGTAGAAGTSGAAGSGGAAGAAGAAGTTGTPLPSGPLAETVARTWLASSSNGANCFDHKTWFTFGADGSVVHRDIDVNACSGTKLLNRFTGVYTLRDRLMEITTNGLGLAKSRLSIYAPKEPVARLVDRFSIVSGKIAPGWIGAGYLALDDGAYTSTDGAHFQSERYVRMESATGGKLFEQNLDVAITVDPPVPVAAGQACTVQVDFTLSQFDAAAPTTPVTGSFRLTYDAVARVTEEGWMRLMPRELDTLPSEERTAVWRGILERAGLWSDYPLTFARTIEMNFVYYLGYANGDPRVLTQILPQTARWLEATTPPPIE